MNIVSDSACKEFEKKLKIVLSKQFLKQNKLWQLQSEDRILYSLF